MIVIRILLFLAGLALVARILLSALLTFVLPRAVTDRITVTREEYDAVCRQLESVGLPLVADREQAWLDFAGWRVNHDDVVRGLAGLTLAPPAPWTSDRATRFPHTWERT